MREPKAEALATEIENIADEFRSEAGPCLDEIEERRNSEIFLLFFAPGVSMTHTIVDSVYSAIRKLNPPIEGDMDVILFSGGGDPYQSYVLTNMLQESVEGRLTFLVPRYAQSAATMLACAGDAIAMGPPSELGFVEPMIVTDFGTSISARSIIDTLRTLSNQGIRPEAIKEAIGLGRVPVEEIGNYKRSEEYVLGLLMKILKARMLRDKQDKAQEVADSLCKGPHGASITRSHAKEIGLKIEELKTDVWDRIWKLHEKWTKVAKIEMRILSEIGKLQMKTQAYPLDKGIFIIAKPTV